MIIGINGRIGSGKDTVGSIIQYLYDKKRYGYSQPSSIQDFEAYLKNGHNKSSKCEIKKFAGKLKQIASLMTGIRVEKFEDQQFKMTEMGEEWNEFRLTWTHGDEGPGSIGFRTEKEAIDFIEQNFEDGYDPSMITFHKMTVREFLQKLGTEAIRDGLHTNAWINALMSDYKFIDYDYPNKANFTEVYPDWVITDVRFPNEYQAVKDKGGIMIRVRRGEIVSTDLHPSETSLDSYKFDVEIDNNGTIEDLVKKVEESLGQYI